MIFSFSRLNDIKRVFEYHGAERKTVFAWEAGDELTVAQRSPPPAPAPALRHQLSDGRDAGLDRAVLGGQFDSLSLNLLTRIAMIPLIAGVSYEIIRAMAKRIRRNFQIDDAARHLAAEPDDARAVGRSIGSGDLCAERVAEIGTGGWRLVVGGRPFAPLTPGNQQPLTTDFMFEKLEAIERTYEELTQQMTDPAVIGDQARYTKVAKQSHEIEPVVEKFRELRKLDRDIAGAKELMRDAEDEEMREIAAAECPNSKSGAPASRTGEGPAAPKPNDEKNVIFEVARRDGRRRGVFVRGGDIAHVRALRRRHGWKFQVTDSSETGLGGIQKAEAIIEGDKVYSRLKHESGVHRVQRVPQTEASGHPHFGGHGCHPSRSRGGRREDRSERHPRRHVLFFGARRPIGQHDLLRRAHHPPAHKHRGLDAGRKIADQEPRKGHAHPAIAAARNRTPEAAGRHFGRAPLAGRQWRSLGEDSHL